MGANRSVALGTTVRILGIDPGYDRIGVAIIEKAGSAETLLHSACIETARTAPFTERLARASRAVAVLIATWHPTVLAIEKLYLTHNQKTAMRVAEARGALILVGVEAGLEMVEITPQQVKIAVTGSGRSAKRQVAAMIPRLVHLVNPKARRHDDEFDAIAIALTASAMRR